MNIEPHYSLDKFVKDGVNNFLFSLVWEQAQTADYF